MTDGFQPGPTGAGSAPAAVLPVPRLDPAAALLFVINASAGAHDIDAKRGVIEAALTARGRKGELLVCGPDDPPRQRPRR